MLDEKDSRAAVKKTPENSAACSCLNCPSYNDCSREKGELLFCSGEVGKSACPYKMNGCLCGACPIHAKYGLKAGYYCLHE